MSFRPLLTRIISYQGIKMLIESFKEFPSPFNEDHFISNEKVENVRWLIEFPSPFNEDHFISKEGNKKWKRK